MFGRNSHIPDDELVLLNGSELSARRRLRAENHLNGCAACRGRQSELEAGWRNFVHAYHGSASNAPLPSGEVARARLRARLREAAAESRARTSRPWLRSFDWRSISYVSGSALVLLVVVLWQSSESSLAYSPNRALTPGAALPVSLAEICRREPEPRPAVQQAALGREVFERYGISNPQPRHYELDYLIDPDLGGSDDAANLWPQPYSAIWSAHVKDALEVHLRDLVCEGKVTLADAQREIAQDWIAAYKKYFRTGRPLAEHLAFEKDQPWE